MVRYQDSPGLVSRGKIPPGEVSHVVRYQDTPGVVSRGKIPPGEVSRGKVSRYPRGSFPW